MNSRVGVLLMILTAGCLPAKDEGKLNDLTIQFDKLMREKSFDYKTTLDLLDSIDHKLSKTVSTDSKAEHWDTFLITKWNSDSSIILIHSMKVFEKGFKREIILNYNDSTIFTYCFRTDPSVEQNDFSFIESFSYCKPSQPIKYVIRVDYGHKSLSDTIDFREKPFLDFSDSIQVNLYDFEIDNAKGILMRN